ncbi:MAG: diphthamide synthesis protein, partial [Methanomassiliicoccales archaeon]
KGLRVVTVVGDSRLALPGQVLGCDYTAAKRMENDVDCFLFLGDGDFHPLGLSLCTSKPVIAASPSDGSARAYAELRERFLRQRYAAIELASKSRSFGILVSFKVGQRRPGVPEALLTEIRGSGRDAFLIHTNVISPDLIGSYNLDAYVCTACPRIAIDDYLRYSRPVLTPLETRIAIGLLPYDALTLDQILGE